MTNWLGFSEGIEMLAVEIDFVLVCAPTMTWFSRMDRTFHDFGVGIDLVFVRVVETDFVLVCAPKMIWFSCLDGN